MILKRVMNTDSASSSKFKGHNGQFLNLCAVRRKRVEAIHVLVYLYITFTLIAVLTILLIHCSKMFVSWYSMGNIGLANTIPQSTWISHCL